MTAYYPVYLNLTGKRCVVIGGGPIAEDKVAKLQDAHAEIILISPTITPTLQAWAYAGNFEWHQREYQPDDLDGAFLGIASTNNREVNQEIFQEAERLAILINVVDDPDQCTFIAPAIVQRGQVTLAISTGGASPALARKLRESLTKDPALEWADLAGVLAAARKEVKERGLTIDSQRWQCCITNDLLELTQSGQEELALSSLLARLTDTNAPDLCNAIEKCSPQQCGGRPAANSRVPSTGRA